MVQAITPTATPAIATKRATRKIVVPGTAPAAKPAKAVAVAKPAVAKPVAGVTRTAATIAANKYPFGNLSDRDNAYLAFFASHAKRHAGVCTLDALATGSERPATTSNKPNDAGVIIRLSKSGHLKLANDQRSFTLTPQASALAVVSKAK